MSEIYRSPFHTDNTVENVTQYPCGLFRAGENWYAKVWRDTVAQYEPIEQPTTLSAALSEGVQRKINLDEISVPEQFVYIREKNEWVPVINDAQAYVQQLERHQSNPDFAPPLTTSLIGRIVRTKTAIESSLLADEVGRTMVFCFPAESLNRFVIADNDEKLRILGYSRTEFAQFRAEEYQFYLVVMQEAVATSSTWNNLKQLFIDHYPELEDSANTLWDELTSVSFAKMEQKVTLDQFSATQPALRTAKQLRGLLYTLWRLNGDFTGTGLTSGGVQELLIPNQTIGQITGSWQPLFQS